MVDKGIELAMMTYTFARTAIYHAAQHAGIPQAKLYPRKKKRSPYPREVWPNAKPFPRRKARS